MNVKKMAHVVLSLTIHLQTTLSSVNKMRVRSSTSSPQVTDESAVQLVKEAQNSTKVLLDRALERRMSLTRSMGLQHGEYSLRSQSLSL